MQSGGEGEAPRLRTVQIGLWQAAAVVLLVGASFASGHGSVASIVGGAGILYLSLLLQHLAVGMALRRARRPGIAIGLFVLKLSLLLGVVAIGFGTSLLAPMSFAAGASTLLLAIVVDTCYGPRSASRPS